MNITFLVFSSRGAKVTNPRGCYDYHPHPQERKRLWLKRVTVYRPIDDLFSELSWRGEEGGGLSDRLVFVAEFYRVKHVSKLFRRYSRLEKLFSTRICFSGSIRNFERDVTIFDTVPNV